MAIIRNADGSRTVGIIPSAPKKAEPTKEVITGEPKAEEITDEVVKTEPKAEPKKTAKKK